MTGMGSPYQDARGNTGRYVKTTAARERAQRAIALRNDGLTYKEIAEELGYSDKKNAWRAIQRLLDHLARPAAEHLINTEHERLLLELERLDDEEERLDELIKPVTAVMQAQHVVVSNGRVVELEGQPIPDDAPVLQAVDRLTRLSAERRAISEQRRRISESLRKLHGADAAQKLDVSGGLKYEVVGVDAADLT
jgi:hypothetical protein